MSEVTVPLSESRSCLSNERSGVQVQKVVRLQFEVEINDFEFIVLIFLVGFYFEITMREAELSSWRRGLLTHMFGPQRTDSAILGFSAAFTWTNTVSFLSTFSFSQSGEALRTWSCCMFLSEGTRPRVGPVAQLSSAGRWWQTFTSAVQLQV